MRIVAKIFDEAKQKKKLELKEIHYFIHILQYMTRAKVFFAKLLIGNRKLLHKFLSKL